MRHSEYPLDEDEEEDAHTATLTHRSSSSNPTVPNVTHQKNSANMNDGNSDGGMGEDAFARQPYDRQDSLNSASGSAVMSSSSSPPLVPRRYPFGAMVLAKELTLTGVVTLVRTLADCLPAPKEEVSSSEAPPATTGISSLSDIPDPPTLPSPRQPSSPKMLKPRSSLHHSSSGSSNDVHNLTASSSILPQHQSNYNNQNSNQGPPELPPLLPQNQIASFSKEQQVASSENVHYTLWISMAWHLLGWAEPSASVFWEVATMFHTLYLASRRGNGQATLNAASITNNVHPLQPRHHAYSMLQTCGSNVSDKSFGSDRGSVHSFNPSSISMMSPGSNADGIFRSSDRTIATNATTNSAASGSSIPTLPLKTLGQRHSSISAKELPLWFLSLQLCLYCAHNNTSVTQNNANGNKSAQMNTSSSAMFQMMQMRMSTTSGGLYGDYTSFVLEHLRLILVLIASPHDPLVLDALGEYLSGTTSPAQTPGQVPVVQSQPSAHILNNFGRRVKLSHHEIERLNFILQRPFGGEMDDLPLSIVEILVPLNIEHQRHSPRFDKDKVPILHVETELRRQLEDIPNSVNLLTQEISGLNLQQQNHQSLKHAPVALHRTPSTESTMSDSGLTTNTQIKTNTDRKELTYTNCNRTTIILRPDYYYGHDPAPVGNDSDQSTSSPSPNSSSLRLHDLSITCCSDVHIYLLQPFEHATISGCHNCTIIIGAVAGLLHVANCDRVDITCATRRIIVRDSHEVRNFCFTPSPPLMVGDVRSCQFGPYNTYYEGLREDLLSTGLAALPMQPFLLDTTNLQILCASNKWKVPVDTSTLESPTSPLTSSNLSTSRSENVSEDAMHTPVLVPASEFNPIFVPMDDSDSLNGNVEEKVDSEDGSAINDNRSERSGSSDENGNQVRMGSRYGRALTDMLQLSPFKLPSEYERRVLSGIERVKSIQQAIISKDLTTDQRLKVEEDLNRGFREWLVTSGNLRQVLDLAHLEESKDPLMKR